MSQGAGGSLDLIASGTIHPTAYAEMGPVEPSNLVVELNEALQWLDRLGITYSRTRFGRYLKCLCVLESQRLAGTNLFLAACQLDAFPALFEANELVAIHKGLGRNDLLAISLCSKLQELVSGPESYINENPGTNSNKPRNIGFELSTIAQLATSGLSVAEEDNGLADVTARFGSSSILVECKRPQSASGVPKAIRAARLQLIERYKRIDTTDITGFIALDITKVLNPKLSLAISSRTLEAASSVSAGMEAFVARYAESWDRVRELEYVGQR